MKKITLLFAFIAVSFLTFSCSSDSSSDGPSQTGSTFTLNYNGTNIPINQITATKSENKLYVYGVAVDGQAFGIFFNKFGDLGWADSYSVESFDFIDQKSHYNFGSNFFNFQMVSLDEVNKRVKVNYSGRVYTDENDILSEYSEVSGTFDVVYIDVVPQIPGMGVSAKIAGSDWYETQIGYMNQFGSDYAENHHINDSAYKLVIVLNPSAISEGSFTFNSASDVNRVQLAKFNPDTMEYTFYNTVGNFNMTDISDVGNFDVHTGSFSFTATNPTNSADVIQVTDGYFKTVHL